MPQSFSNIWIHATWATKLRLPVLDKKWRITLFKKILETSKDKNINLDFINGIEDHVHSAVSIPPKIAIADFIGQVKGYSSYFVNHELAPPYQFGWQREYGVVSFGEKSLDMVVNYIKNQKQHHRKNTTIAFLEKIVKK